LIIIFPSDRIKGFLPDSYRFSLFTLGRSLCFHDSISFQFTFVGVNGTDSQYRLFDSPRLDGVTIGAMLAPGCALGISILTGGLLGAFGLFFRFWLFSILLGENLWLYVITQATNFIDWIFTQLGILAKPTLLQVQSIAVVGIFVNSLLYLFAVHLVALLVSIASVIRFLVRPNGCRSY